MPANFVFCLKENLTVSLESSRKGVGFCVMKVRVTLKVADDLYGGAIYTNFVSRKLNAMESSCHRDLTGECLGAFYMGDDVCSSDTFCKYVVTPKVNGIES